MALMVAQEVPTASSTMGLPHGPTGVAEARRKLRGELYAQAVPEPVIDDAVLILSELLSNSCRHARPLGDGDDTRPAYGSPGARGGLTAAASSTGGTGSASAAGTASVMGTASAVSTGTPGGGSTAATGERTACGIRVAWTIGTDGLLAVEVTDGGGPTRPRPASPSLTAHGGRGLGIVGSLALRWGVRDAPGEVTVWALLPVRGRHARRDGGPYPVGLPRGIPFGVPVELPLDLAESLDDFG